MCVKGKVDTIIKKGKVPNIIQSPRGRTHEKPVEFYEIIEQLVPDGNYLEIFGRRNNVRTKWTTVGNDFEEFYDGGEKILGKSVMQPSSLLLLKSDNVKDTMNCGCPNCTLLRKMCN